MDEDYPKPKFSFRWPIQRLARAAQLFGMGWSLEEIAEDPLVMSSPRRVRAALKRAKIFIEDAPLPGRYRLDLARKHSEVWRLAAARRHTTAEALLRRIAEIMADEPTYIENILDDGR